MRENTKLVGFRMPIDLYQQLKAHCHENRYKWPRVNMQIFITNAVTEFLEKSKPKKRGRKVANNSAG